MQRKRYTDFHLLLDSIGATGFLLGYTVPIFQLQFVGGDLLVQVLVHVQMYFLFI